jgi:hypothetical protein
MKRKYLLCRTDYDEYTTVCYCDTIEEAMEIKTLLSEKSEFSNYYFFIDEILPWDSVKEGWE